MAIYMPPLCRKKKNLERYNPDSFRVISYVAEETHPNHDHFEEGNKPSEWRRQWLQNEGLALPDIHNKRTEVLPHSAPDFRMNKPHPGSCGFLRHNVRILNEPICSVYTQVPADDNQHWWPSRVSNEPLQVPQRTTDTIYRSDFLDHVEKPPTYGSKRHTSNPHTEPALGTVPVNFLRPKDGSQRLFKEKISYEHQYNSRIDPNYPIRAKRHGSFVWDPMSSEASKKFINHYSVISPEEGKQRQEVYEAEKLACETSKLLRDMDTEQLAQGDFSQAQTEAKPAENNGNTTQEPEKISEADGSDVKQASPKGSKKGSPPASGQGSPKASASNKNPLKPGSPKKVSSSRKRSVSNGQKASEKCNTMQKCDPANSRPTPAETKQDTAIHEE